MSRLRTSCYRLTLLLALLLPRTSSATAAAPPGRYAVTAEVVTDTRTKLAWQRSVPPASYAQVDATAYCSSLALSGGGWRLPTGPELVTIVDLTQSKPAIDSLAFPATPSDWFWTSTPYLGGGFWAVRFEKGQLDTVGKDGPWRVRCVRKVP
ncbi:MAG: putative secreted protein [Myxococcaceae bacterium]|nr:putative secreted protein [Myxococcaceae bacterium]